MNKEDKPALFPPGYEQLEKQVLEVNQRIRGIGEQIKNMPYDRGPTFEFHPPGGFRLPHPLTRDQRIEILQNHKSELQTGARNLVKSKVIHADKDTARKITDIADKLIDPGPYDERDKSSLETARGEVKSDIDQSQDFMRALRFNHHHIEEPQTGGNPPDPEIDRDHLEKP